MGLVVPTHVARAQRAQAHKPGQFTPVTALPLLAITDGKSAEHVWPIDTPVPAGLPEPEQWRVSLMPVCQVSKTRGNIILAPETLDTQDWTHQLWKVCKVGPFVYRGPAWQGFTEDDLAAARARLQPGALYLVDPKAPRRYHFTTDDGKKMLVIVVNDDQLWSWVDPAYLDRLSFRGLEL